MAITSKPAIRLSEKQFMGQIIELAKLCGWLHYHTHNSKHSPAGWPDLVLVRPPSALFIELKTDTGRLTPQQRMWLGALEQCPGIETHLWRPGDWDTIIARLQK